MYLQLGHGRHKKDQCMDEFGHGFDGPCIGPFEKLVGDYGNQLRMIDGPKMVFLHVDDDDKVISFGDEFFGDYLITSEPSKENKIISLDEIYEHSLAQTL